MLGKNNQGKQDYDALWEALLNLYFYKILNTRTWSVLWPNFAKKSRSFKKERKTVSLADRLDHDIFKISDDKLLKGC